MLVTNGGKQAVYEAFATLLDPGDEVIVPAPYWTTYPEAIQLAGGVTVPVLAGAASGYKLTVEQLEAARTPRTKVLAGGQPVQPDRCRLHARRRSPRSGAGPLDAGLWVITDEIYEHLVYGDARFSSIPVQVPELADRCIVVNGVAKTYAMTGWRVGWLIGPRDVVGAATNLQSHATSNVSNVAQVAALAAVTGDLTAVHEMRHRLRPAPPGDARRARRDPRRDLPAARRAPSTATPTSPRCSAGRSTAAPPTPRPSWPRWCSKRSGWPSCPGEAFGAPGAFRMSYALGDDDLAEGVRRLHEVLSLAF